MYRNFFKRIIDILISLIILPFYMLLMVFIGFAIKLDDGGPLYFKGERLGKDMKRYKMYKFRSMKVNAPDLRNDDGSTFNSNQDSRLTRVGKTIRKLSIDEIPQIINVLKGDMSLIGPRPSPLGNEHLYSKEYLQKFTVKPGITGYSQAYYRNSISLEKKQGHDLYYVENISLRLDIKILVKTVFTVVKQEGLYTNDETKKDDQAKTT